MLPTLRKRLKTISDGNKGLQDILRSMQEGTEILSVEPYNGKVHNTKITLLLKGGEKRVHFYNRLSLKKILEAYPAVVGNTIDEAIENLNLLGFDFTTDDIDLVSGSIVAKPTSLGYYNEAETIPEDEIMPSNEMYFTTLAGSADYVGTQGDQILLSDGSIVDITITDNTVTFNVPSGKHTVKLVKSADRSSYVSIGGGALVELHNFPTLSTVTKFNFSTYEYTYLDNLIKVPDFFPSNIIDIKYMFYRAGAINQDISMWDVSNVTDMGYMFTTATSFNQPLTNWDVSNVTNMERMFANATSFNQPLTNWDVSNVTDMGYMFGLANSFDQDLSNWCVSNIPTMPVGFNTGVPLLVGAKLPVWGTCPSP